MGLQTELRKGVAFDVFSRILDSEEQFFFISLALILGKKILKYYIAFFVAYGRKIIKQPFSSAVLYNGIT